MKTVTLDGRKVLVDKGGYNNWKIFHSLVKEVFEENKKPFLGIYIYEGKTLKDKDTALFYSILFNEDAIEKDIPITISLTGRDKNRVKEIEKILCEEADKSMTI